MLTLTLLCGALCLGSGLLLIAYCWLMLLGEDRERERQSAGGPPE
jgi:hypothetical protein